MTEKDRQKIVALWVGGTPIEQIYRLLPYRRMEAKKMVDELRADGTLQPRKRAETVIKAVAVAWKNETKDPYELAKMFGISIHTIKAYLKRSGVREGKRPPHNFKKRDFNEKAIAIMCDLREGKSSGEIAKNYGVSRQYVHQLKKRLDE